MRKALFTICATLCVSFTSASASEVGAERIQKEYRLSLLQWRQQVAAAPSVEAKAALLEKAPDASAYGVRMMKEIGGDLKQEWTLPHVTWLMQNHPELKVTEVMYLLGIVEKAHMKSGQIGKFCVALVGAASGDTSKNPETGLAYQVGFLGKKVNFIEKVIQQTPHKRVKGEASLALSIALGQMGGVADLNQRRLDLIRTAIIEAVDSKIGETTVKKLAQEELYRMTKLSKGVEGPDLIGRDAQGSPMKLSDYRGKIVMLVFWSSWDSGDKVLAYLKKSAQQHEGKALQIIGVNRDTRENLKTLTDLGQTTGRNFSDPNEELFKVYRVDTVPWCVVLDKKGVIKYTGPLGSFADLTVDAVLAEKE